MNEVDLPADARVRFEDGERRYDVWVEDGLLYVRTFPDHLVVMPVASNEIRVGQTA